jgi:hypothetical protein
MDRQVRSEIEQFLRAKAPGLVLTMTDNPAFDSTTIKLTLSVEQTRLVSNQTPDREVGEKIVEMLAEVQKAAVTSIGLEEYVRTRQVEVLEDVRQQVAEMEESE